MDCKDCKNKTTDVPYIVHESAMARSERRDRRKDIVIVVLSVLLAACCFICFFTYKTAAEKIESNNAKWLEYMSQYDIEDYTVDVSTDDGGDASYIGGNGDIYNGANSGQKTDTP